MADDDSEASAKNQPPEKVVKALNDLLDSLAPEPPAATAEAPKRPIDELYGAVSSADISASTQGAAAAVGRYRNAMRWLVAAVGAIGVVLFGSTVFTDGDALASAGGKWSLALAAAGLAAILYAATLVFEPVDASLGELQSKFSSIDSTGWAISPRHSAVLELRARLTGEEAPAHLGPGHDNVSDLIRSIQVNEAARAHNAKAVSARVRDLEHRTKNREVATSLLEALVKARSSMPDPQPPNGQVLDARIVYATTELEDAVRLERQARSNLVVARDRLEQTDHQLGMDILHRSLVLDESAVAELRGTFRLSRWVLLMGAIATLVGAVGYLNALNDDADEPKPPMVRTGTLVVSRSTPAAKDFTSGCLDVTLQVVVPQEEIPGIDDAFEVLVSDPDSCKGTFAIPGNRGDDDIDLDLNSPLTITTDSTAPSTSE